MPSRAGSFGTFLIVGPTCFFLGILFIFLPYDYYVLWSTPPTSLSSSANNALFFFKLQETHLRILHQSPPLIARILNLVIATGILGFCIKLLPRPSDANLLFDGASLMLYLVAVILYVANIVKGLRAVTAGVWDLPALPGGGAGGSAPALPLGAKAMAKDGILGKEDSLRVIAASNTILALVLMGVLVLQAGQWYAQVKEENDMIEMKKAEDHARAVNASTTHNNGSGVNSSNGASGVASSSLSPRASLSSKKRI